MALSLPRLPRCIGLLALAALTLAVLAAPTSAGASRPPAGAPVAHPAAASCAASVSGVARSRLLKRAAWHRRLARIGRRLARRYDRRARQHLRRARSYGRRRLVLLARRQGRQARVHSRLARRRARAAKRHLRWARWYERRARRTCPAAPKNAQPTPGNPLAGLKFFIDPDSDAALAERSLRPTRPADADLMNKIAIQPQADWFVSSQGANWRQKRLEQIFGAGATPVIVLYNIPNRDCGSYNAGGEAASAQAYQEYIGKLISLIGGRKTVVILEPDALPQALESWCLSPEQRQSRISILRETARTLGAQPNLITYMDAGQAHWHSAAEMAPALLNAGIEYIQGFSVNVSSYLTTSDMITFGNAISAATGGKHFVMDTGRNGNGPAPGDEWCNPPGRALGDRPTTSTASPAADAYLWIHRPGGTDGPCNGFPAFSFSQDYALGLASRASY